MADHEFRGNARFEVIRRLGQGGMGVVYEAQDRERNERVALKTLRSLTPDSLLRFKQEFRALQDIEHQNLISLGELIGDEDEWFFTMELIDGRTFLDYVCPTPAAKRSYDDVETIDAPSVGSLGAPPPPASERRCASTYDEALLRHAIAQLVRGLMALHAAGKIHRDVKPSNVLVDGTGRLVVLDFGLVVDHARGPQVDALEGPVAEDRSIAGTIDYMSPEQAAGHPLDPAADWYAVGIMLYEALTGRVPFEGDPISILTAKQREEALPPRHHEPTIPAELDALCADLIRFSPSERPTGMEILERLGARTPSAERAPPASSLSVHRRFVGRKEELERLRDAFEASQLGRGCAAFISGESGVGKSALVRRFVEDMRAQHPQLTVLAGRCYERESVPYKAVDGVIDALSKHLGRFPKQETQQLLPRHAELLAGIFPVLSRNEAFAEAAVAKDRIVDPQELRSRAFGALRELLRSLAQQQPIIVVIDDLQWADADSLALLGEVLRPPDAPPLFMLATLRPVASMPRAPHLPSVTVELSLDRLSPTEARELAEQLIRTLAPGNADAHAIADEAGGHPLFIDELIRHAATPRTATTEPLQLEDAFWTRIRELDEPARRLLEVIALAGGPLQQETAALAASVGSDFSRRIGTLKVAHLVRTSGSRGSDHVETYHDRVRAAVTSHLSRDVVVAQHRRLAIALEASGVADPDALVVHWREAGSSTKAAHYAALAAANAENALAFDRAARLYRECLDLLGPTAEGARELQVKMGAALANAGRGAQSAEAYLAAAEQSNATLGLELRRRAAEQLLRTGHIEQGSEVLRDVLSAVNLTAAESPRRALLSLVVQRARLRLRGLRHAERSSTELSSETLTRIDTCWSAATGLSMIDMIRGAEFQTRHLLLALDAGEPYRVARALCMEAALVATEGAPSSARARKLHAEAEQLSERLQHPHALGIVRLVAGVLSFQLGGWAAANAALEAAQRTLRERCTGVAWELATANVFRVGTLFYLGRFDELVTTVPALIQEGNSRGDLYATTNLRLTHMNATWLVLDDPRRAREEASQAMRDWPLSGYLAQHYYELFAQVNIDLYSGDGRAAWQRVASQWSALEKSLFLRAQVIRIEAYHLRARAALGALGADAKGEQAGALVACVRDCVRRLRKEAVPWSLALAGLVAAALDAHRGDVEAAIAALATSEVTLDAGGMSYYALAARRRRLELARAATPPIEAPAHARLVARPERLVDMLAPMPRAST